MSLTSLSEANVESPESTCNIDGAMLWHFNSRNQELLNLAAASTWLSHVMHSTLLVPSKILMFFIICLLTSSFLLFVTCAKFCVSASVMLADGAEDVPSNGVGAVVVLCLGWWGSWLFWNQGPGVVMPVVPVVPVLGSGGDAAVG